MCELVIGYLKKTTDKKPGGKRSCSPDLAIVVLPRGRRRTHLRRVHRANNTLHRTPPALPQSRHLAIRTPNRPPPQSLLQPPRHTHRRTERLRVEDRIDRERREGGVRQELGEEVRVRCGESGEEELGKVETQDSAAWRPQCVSARSFRHSKTDLCRPARTALP